jgi:hypothetical protein
MKDKPDKVKQKLSRQNLRAFGWIIGWRDLDQINANNQVALRKPLQDF